MTANIIFLILAQFSVDLSVVLRAVRTRIPSPCDILAKIPFLHKWVSKVKIHLLNKDFCSYFIFCVQKYCICM